MAINDILEIGRQGLNANRQALQTTANNIANANTPGFTRRRAQLETINQGTQLNGLQLGGGVNVKKAIRIHDDFVEQQLVAESQAFGATRVKSENLSRIEGVVTSQGTALGDMINKFFDDYRQLSMNPETSALRNVVQSSATAVADGFNAMEGSIDGMKRDLDLRIGGCVGEINTHIRDIASLNEGIAAAEARGDTPNDMYDRRDVALRELSQKIDFNWSKDQLGQVCIVAGGSTLVQGNRGSELSLQKGPGDGGNRTPGSVDIYLGVHKTGEHVGRPITNAIKGGELGGMMFVRDQVLTTAKNHLDQLAHQFSTSVNEVHRDGLGMDGQGGRTFFTDLGEKVEGAANLLKVSDEIKQNHELIAAGSIPGAVGDNSIAKAISDLQNAKDLPGGNLAGDFANHTLTESLHSLVGNVGTHTQRETNAFQHQQAVVNQLDNYRQSIAGVSLEEEAVNLVQFQTAFNASAKAMKVGDELFQTVLTLKN